MRLLLNQLVATRVRIPDGLLESSLDCLLCQQSTIRCVAFDAIPLELGHESIHGPRSKAWLQAGLRADGPLTRPTLYFWSGIMEAATPELCWVSLTRIGLSVFFGNIKDKFVVSSHP